MRDFRYFDTFLSIQYHQFLHHSFGDVWQKTRNIRYTPVTHIQSVHHEHNTCTSEDMGRFCLNLIKKYSPNCTNGLSKMQNLPASEGGTSPSHSPLFAQMRTIVLRTKQNQICRLKCSSLFVTTTLRHYSGTK